MTGARSKAYNPCMRAPPLPFRLLPAALALACSCPWAQAAAPRIDAPAPLEALLQRHLQLETPRDEAERQALQTRLAREGRQLLATEGYFDPGLELEGENLEDLVLRVGPGSRARIREIRIHIDGLVPETRRQELLEAWPLKPGLPFRQADWTQAKEQLLQALLERDYPAARITHSQAEVDADSGQVVLEVTAHSGPAYRFGELKLDGLLRYKPDLVERYNTQVEPGDPYEEGRLQTLQTRLENTPYFNSVSVRIDPDAAEPGPDGSLTAPVRIRLRERQPHQLGLGAGLSSNTGARVEMNYRSADLFRKAWQLNSGIRLEQLKQSAYADIFLPPTRDQSQYAFGVLFERSDIQNLKLQTQSLGISRTRQQGSVDLSLNLGYIEEKQTPQDMESRHTRALTFNSIWTWQPFRGQIERVEGYSSQVQLGGSIKPVSDQNFVRLYGKHQHSLALGSRNTLSLRAEGGIILAPSRQGIPQNFLFRAGGTQSVRGYSYQSLGVQEGQAVLGGRYLTTLSAELTHWLADSPWGIAAFVDAGNAGDDKKTFKLKTGYGLGARWKSPAGPLGVDIAYGDSWHLHFALALPF